MTNSGIIESRQLFARVARSVIVVVLAAVSLALMPGCSEPERQIRLALNPWPGYAFLFLAEEQGFFKDEDVDVRLVECMSLADVRRTFELQQSDIMACTLVEALMAGEQSLRKPQIAMVADFSKGGDVLIAHREIESLAELHGRRIALEPASLDVVNVHMALQHAELQIGDVTVVPSSQSEMARKFERGEVDAVQCYPPVSSALLARDDTHVLFDSSQIPNAITDVLAADSVFVSRHADKLAAIIRAYRRAQSFYLKHPEAAVQIMARRTGMTPDEFSAGLAGVVVVYEQDESVAVSADVESRLEKSLSITTQALVAIGLISESVVPNDFVAPLSSTELAVR